MSADSICAFLCAPVPFEEIYSPPELGDCVLMEQSSVPGGRGGLRSALPLAARLCRFHKAKRLKEPPGRKNVQWSMVNGQRFLRVSRLLLHPSLYMPHLLS